MKKIFIGLSAIFAFAFGFTGCDTDYVTYSGPDYIMFSDTLTVLPVQNKEDSVAYRFAALCLFSRRSGVVKYAAKECPEFICPPACAMWAMHWVRKSLNLAYGADS